MQTCQKIKTIQKQYGSTSQDDLLAHDVVNGKKRLWVQLKTGEGDRAVHCRTCGKQERTLLNRCQYNVVWHQCPIYRIDPAEHIWRNVGVNKRQPKEEDSAMEQEAEIEKDNQSKKQKIEENNKLRKRKAPIITGPMKTINANIAKKHWLAEAYQRSRMFVDQMLNEHMKAPQERLKAKEAEAIASSSSSRAQCIIPHPTLQEPMNTIRMELKAATEAPSRSIDTSRKSFLAEIQGQITSNRLKPITSKKTKSAPDQ